MRYGPVRRSGRSRDGSASKYRRTCSKNMGSSRWVRPMARSRTASLPKTQCASTISTSGPSSPSPTALPKSRPIMYRTGQAAAICATATSAMRGDHMAVVETEQHGQILVVRMNRPERLNALSQEMRTRLAEAWTEFRRSNELEVAIFTGVGRAFCAGEDMKESLQRGQPGGVRPEIEDPFMTGALEKPVIAAVNGYAMGGGFMLVERTDLRVAAKGAVFEVSEAKRWLLGGYNHGHLANLPYPIAMEMALGFRFTAERFYEIGFLNRLVEPDELIPEALKMAEHLLTLP